MDCQLSFDIFFSLDEKNISPENPGLWEIESVEILFFSDNVQ